MATGVEDRFSRGRALYMLWFAWLAGPVAWMLHLLLSYTLVRWVCASGALWALHAVTAVALGLAGAGVWAAWRIWRLAGRPWSATESGVAGRTRFMAVAALVFSIGLLLVIMVQAIPPFIADPCQ